MDWNGNLRMPYVSRPADNSNLSLLYNCTFDQFPVLEMKQPSMQEAMLTTLMEKNMHDFGHDSKKKRLSNDQLELLENSFQEEIKLDPDRKMKLAKELGLQPRQIAIWFQNRRARWKGKQLERLYDALKQELDNVSRDKQKLQQEVLALRDQVGKKQVSRVCTDLSGEETVESTSIPTNLPEIGESSYAVNMEEYNNGVMMPPYWTTASLYGAA